MARGSAKPPGVVVKRKEADKIPVPQFPNMVSLPQWKAQVAKSVVCASSQANGKEMEWFSESFQHGMTFAALADSGEDRYASLDIKLSVALTTMIRGAPTARVLCDDLVNREDAAFRAGRMLKGRQLAWVVNHFSDEPFA